MLLLPYWNSNKIFMVVVHLRLFRVLLHLKINRCTQNKYWTKTTYSEEKKDQPLGNICLKKKTFAYELTDQQRDANDTHWESALTGSINTNLSDTFVFEQREWNTPLPNYYSSLIWHSSVHSVCLLSLTASQNMLLLHKAGNVRHV